MKLTRDSSQTINERIERDPEFAKALLSEASTLLLGGDTDVGCLILRDLVKAVVGFDALSELMDKPSESLQHMLSDQGNARMNEISAVIGAIQARLQVRLEIRVHSVE